MARRVPVSRLNSVDLPTFGRPTITSDGNFVGIRKFAPLQTVAAGGFQSFNLPHSCGRCELAPPNRIVALETIDSGALASSPAPEYVASTNLWCPQALFGEGA